MSFIPIDSWLFQPPRPPTYNQHLKGLKWLPCGPNGGMLVPVVVSNSTRSDAKYIVIYAHGNAMDLGGAAQFLSMLQTYMPDVHAMAFEYPGYGLFHGKGRHGPTAVKCIQTLQAVLEFVTDQLKFDEQNIILLGQSIGTGVVSACVNERSRFACVSLVSPFTSIKDEVQHLMGSWTAKLVRDPFPSIVNVSRYGGPLAVIHGRQDQLIPCEHGERLYNACPSTNKQLLLLDHASHNNIPITSIVETISKCLTRQPVGGGMAPQWDRFAQSYPHPDDRFDDGTEWTYFYRSILVLAVSLIVFYFWNATS